MQCLRLWWAALALLLWAPHIHCRTAVTHEDIRDAMVSLIRMFMNSDDKLARHEQREKAVGETMKKMLKEIDKSQKSFEPIKGIVSRLDDRLANIETIILQKEQREKETQNLTNSALEAIQKSIQALTDSINHNVKPAAAEPTHNLDARLAVTDTKIDALRTEIENLKKNLSKDHLQAICSEASDSTSLDRFTLESEKLLDKFELTMNEFVNSSRVPIDYVPLNEVSLADEAWHSKMTEVMERQEKEIKIKSCLKFKRLFPVMVSNILGNGSLAEKMVAILTKITRTWPSFIAIGKSTLYDYLSQGSKERLTAPMIKCVMALGRRALVDCLEEHLQHLHAATQHHPDLRDVMLNVSTILLRSEPTTYLEDYVTTDYTLYEILGDSIMPRRTIFPYKDPIEDENSVEKTTDEELYQPLRTFTRQPKVRLVLIPSKQKPSVPRDAWFEPTKFKNKTPMHIKIKGCRSKEVSLSRDDCDVFNNFRCSGVSVASGLLNRFRYRLHKIEDCPIYGALIL